MAEYRAYIIGVDGRFLRAIELICPDDKTAKEYAVQLVDGHDIELWQQDRMIAAFKRTNKAASAGGLLVNRSLNMPTQRE